MESTLNAVFNPQSIAVIGASGAPGKLGYDILYNLINAKFQGKIYPVNPKADTLLGLNAYKNIESIPDAPDLAVVVIPSKFVPGTIEQCGKAGVKAAIVITGGFAESGDDGQKLQEELTSIAKQYGIRVIGPNCQGVNNPHHKLCASWPLLTTKGNMAFIAQSGTVGAALMDWASQDYLGVSVFVSLGNRADVDESDCIEYFNNDPNTKVIALYVEGIKRPQYFLEVLSKATKPVVILKAGRTAKGKIAAESHTKSMAGTDEIYNAIFKKYKVHRADSLEELYDFAKALAYMKKPMGKKMLNISSSGGAAILAIDEAEKCGFEVPDPSKDLKEKLAKFLPAHCSIGNPVDLTGDAMSNPDLYAQVMKTAKSEYDIMVVIFGDPIQGASDIVTPGASELVIFCGGADIERQECALMHKKGIPAFPTPERGIKAMSQLFQFDEFSVKPKKTTHQALGHLQMLSAKESVTLLKQYKIPAVNALLASSPYDAVDIAKKIGMPVAMKIASPDIYHKSDVNGVYLNISGDDKIYQTFEKIISSAKQYIPDAKIDGVTLSPMAKPNGLETIIGMITDPQYGKCLMFGLGGIFTEIYKDIQFCMIPAIEDELSGIIKNIKGYPLLEGVRGQKPKDKTALIQLMKSISDMVKEHPEIDQIDLNPVLVYEQGVSVVDYRILYKKAFK